MPLSSAASDADDADIVDFKDLESMDGTGSDASMMLPPTSDHSKTRPRSSGSHVSSSRKSSKTSVSGSPGQQGNCDQKGGLQICLMPNCNNPQKKKSKWCNLHNCHFDNLKYAIEHSKNGSKEKRVAWCEEMKDVNKAIAAITQHAEVNAGISKWKNTNKQHLNLEWQEESGARLNQAKGQRLKPFEKEEFVIKHVTKKGWFDEFSRILLWPAWS